jgi:hypothetical protein
VTPELGHCLAKIAEIVGQGEASQRAVFQLGYNLGRIAELAGLGRESCWDLWKDPVSVWNQAKLQRLVQQLRTEVAARVSPPE